MKEEEKKQDNGIDKEVSQRDSVKEAEDELKNSLYFYRNIIDKMEKDLICYKCKENIKDIDKENKNNIMMIVPVRECDPGMWACVSACSKCQEEMIKQQENEGKKK